MSDPFPYVRVFLDQAWPHGVIATAVHCGENPPEICRVTPDLCAGVTAEFWQTLDEGLTHLAAHGCAEATSDWVFETVLLFVTRREDGHWAAALVTPDLTLSAREFVQARLADFSSAQPANS